MDSKRKIIELDLNSILPNRFQPRIAFDESGLIELTESIKHHGVINPIIVRKLGEKFEIIAGERRYKASTLAGLKTIPAIITDFNDKESSEIALIENVQRRDLTPIEEAISYKRILDMNYLTQDELAKKLGKTQSTIANKLRLLNLCDDVQEALLDGKISERHARSLLKIKNSAQQKLLLNRIIDERLTVRRTDEEIDKMFNENDNQKSNYINVNNLDIPSSDIIGDDNTEVLNTNVSSGVDMLYNQATMNIPKIMGEDIQQYEENQNNKPILNEPIEELSFGFENNNNNNYNNPGFMDISNIESNAKDIFEEKPVKPFFFSEPEPVAPVTIETPVEEPVAEPVEERQSLINPMFMQETEEPVVEQPIVENNTQPVVSSDGFDFDFIPAETVHTNQVNIPELADLEQFGSFNNSLADSVPAVESNVSLVSETQAEPEIIMNENNEVNSSLETMTANPVDDVVFETTTEPVVSTENVVQEPAVEQPASEVVQDETLEEPKKEEKKSFFDRLKSLVDNKNDKLEEPVVEPEVTSQVPETPVVSEAPEEVSNTYVDTPSVEIVPETNTSDNLEVLENKASEVANIDVIDNNVSNTVDSNEELEVLDFGSFDLDTPNVEPVVAPQAFETPVVSEVPEEVDNTYVDVPNVEPTAQNNYNDNIIETPNEVVLPNEEINTENTNDVVVEESAPEVLEFNSEQAETEVPFVGDNNNVDINEINQSYDQILTDANQTVEEIDDTPVVQNDTVEMIEEIPMDIINSLNDETPVNNDMPAELAEIVANPELTNNFANEEEPVVEQPIVEESTIKEPEINNYEMPFQTILDDVVIPEEPIVEESTAIDSNETVFEPVINESNDFVQNTTENDDVNAQPDLVDEFSEFTPETLPIEEDEIDTKEDLTAPLYSPIYEDPVMTEVPSLDNDNIVNMGAAMRVIREATEELQKLGFIVDTEEFDFENMYQVIFKINKNLK